MKAKVPQRGREPRRDAAGAAGGPNRRPRLLLVVNVDWFFLSHRLPIALAAREAGMEVIVAAGDTGRAEEIRANGLGFTPLSLSRGGTDPFAEARTFAQLLRLYRRVRPDIVHHVTVKPVLYGSLAARLAGVPSVVNAISGLGYVFTAEGRARALRALLLRVYRLALASPGVRTIFQNSDDLGHFVDQGLIRPEHAVLIRGSGVDCSVFRPAPEPPGRPVVLLPARMLRDKGIYSFVEAARSLHDGGSDARFVLAGDPDPHNPSTVTEAEIRGWVDEGVVEWWGHREDMPDVLRQSAVVVLPSHREGLPKVLLEAAACGKPLVAADVPGCREIVRHDRNGLLVPARASEPLAETIETLLADPELRRRFGAEGRRMAEREFRLEIVVQQTLDLYRTLLSRSLAAGPGET